MREQDGNGLGREKIAGSLEAEKVLGQSHDVLGTFAQRGHTKLKLAETMEKILAKSARLDCGIEILIGGSDDANIDFDFAVTTQAIERISIQNAQKLDLSLQLQLADFIEEQAYPCRPVRTGPASTNRRQ